MLHAPFVWKHTRYSHHPLHQLLQSNEVSGESNVGTNGRDLTIATVFEEPESLVRLIESLATHMPFYAGELLVVTSTHQAGTKLTAEAMLKDQPFRWRVLETDGNGQAHFRNMAAKQARSHWLLWLRPNVEVLWNFLPVLQRDLDELGCHFMSVRAHEARAHAYNMHHLIPSLADGHIAVGLGCADKGEPAGCFLSTALCGVGYLIELRSFHELGGYDEDLAGLEDLDFSLRLYRKGYKVGVASITGIDATTSDEGIEPPHVEERVRARFEEKNDIIVFPLAGLQGIVPVDLSTGASQDARPRIALIVDLEDWAFANISKQIVAALSHEFAFEIIPLAIVEDVPRVFMMCKDADLIHFFWREVPKMVRSPHYRHQLELKGLGYDYFNERYLKSKVFTAAVYDHLFLSEAEILERTDLFNDYVDAYYVCSQRLYDIYSSIKMYKPPAAILPDGVDLAKFSPDNLQRFDTASERPLVLGWVGNSKWANHLGDPKGLHTILKPAIEELRSEGLNIEEFFADRQIRMIAHADMPAYYNKIDVLICTSEIEGTPNPVLEAMACGVPVITTDVGIVPQAFGELQKEFILPERNVATLKDAIRRLFKDPSLLQKLSAENLTSIAPWNWPIMAAQFGPFFHKALQPHSHANRRQG